MLKLIHGDCLTAMRVLGQFDCVMADPPDNLGLAYGEYDDSLPDHEYLDLLNSWFLECVMHAPIVWFSFNAKWTAQFGACVTEFLNCRPEWTYRACTQAFTFGQHNHRWLGNNHRPLWCIYQRDARFFPDAIRVPSWRQRNGDKRADPRGRVPGDLFDMQYPSPGDVFDSRESRATRNSDAIGRRPNYTKSSSSELSSFPARRLGVFLTLLLVRARHCEYVTDSVSIAQRSRLDAPPVKRLQDITGWS